MAVAEGDGLMAVSTAINDLRGQLRTLQARIASSEAYIIHARGKDRRLEQRHLANLRRQRAALLEQIHRTGSSQQGAA
jgi:hypothetical protein